MSSKTPKNNHGGKRPGAGRRPGGHNLASRITIYAPPVNTALVPDPSRSLTLADYTALASGPAMLERYRSLLQLADEKLAEALLAGEQWAIELVEKTIQDRVFGKAIARAQVEQRTQKQVVIQHLSSPSEGVYTP